MLSSFLPSFFPTYYNGRNFQIITRERLLEEAEGGRKNNRVICATEIFLVSVSAKTSSFVLLLWKLHLHFKHVGILWKKDREERKERNRESNVMLSPCERRNSFLFSINLYQRRINSPTLKGMRLLRLHIKKNRLTTKKNLHQSCHVLHLRY